MALVANGTQSTTTHILVQDESGNQLPAVSITRAYNGGTNLSIAVDVHNAAAVAANMDEIKQKVLTFLQTETADAVTKGIPFALTADV